MAALKRVAEGCRGITAVVGFVDSNDDIYNAAAILHDGRLADVYHKQYLPNYGVFDENRYFQPATAAPSYVVAGVGVGVNICEDIWYPGGPTRAQALAGAEVIININASPYHAGKRRFREQMLATRAADNAVFVCYVNLVGGQDELVFDGASMVLSPAGRAAGAGGGLRGGPAGLRPETWTRCSRPASTTRAGARSGWPRPRPRRAALVRISAAPLVKAKPPVERGCSRPLEDEAEVYQALVLGTRDYVRKNGFQQGGDRPVRRHRLQPDGRASPSTPWARRT